MGWRIIFVKNRCKLEARMGYLVQRTDEIVKIHLSEIAILVIESLAVTITSNLINELAKYKVKVIFCDEKHLPRNEILNINSGYDTTACIKKQFLWDELAKYSVWQYIVKSKIDNQANNLILLNFNKEALHLKKMIKEVELGDRTNREGHAAKIYFNSLFGKYFSRRNDCLTNSCLNYGYSLLLSTFSKEISIRGYLPQIGIWHDNNQNPLNFACDLMEPFRFIPDRIVAQLDLKNCLELTPELKKKMHTLFEFEIEVDGRKFDFLTAARIFVSKVIYSLETSSTDELTGIKYA